jgi:hypothetical protein
LELLPATGVVGPGGGVVDDETPGELDEPRELVDEDDVVNTLDEVLLIIGIELGAGAVESGG